MKKIILLFSFLFLFSGFNVNADIGDSASEPASSCWEIIQLNPSAADGIYWLQNGSMTSAQQYYCNMTTDGGGWQLLFQRRGGQSNTELCGTTVNDFLHNGSCGSVSDLSYGDSYNPSDVDTTIANFSPIEYANIQYNSSMVADVDDAYILHTTANIFPNSPSASTVIDIPITQICDINNANCDNTNVFWKYIGDAWYHSSQCVAGNASNNTSFRGNYGYCHDGFDGTNSSRLYGNRDAYDETKLVQYGFGQSSAFAERFFIRNKISFTQSTNTLTVGENAGTGTYTIVLDAEPTSNVVIDLTSSDTAEGTVAPSSLTFTPANWNSPQTVTVTGVDDNNVGTHTATITASINDASSANEFDALSDQTVAVTFTDDDAASIVIDPTGITTTGLTLLENAGTGTFNVRLGSQPLTDVVIDLTSNDTGEATVSPATLTFTNTNWNTDQQVTVTAVNDDIDRNDSTTLTISVNDAASDNTYDSVPDATAAITITDDDTAGVTQSTNTLTVGENAGTGTYTIVLDAEPTSNVVIDLTSSDTAEGTVAPSSLTFTPANWNSPQTVTVTGVDDNNWNINHTANIIAEINNSSATEYQPLSDQTVSATYTNDDIDITAPPSPTINTVREDDNKITGTGEAGTTITLNPITCTNTPITVQVNGTWVCENPSPDPEEGQNITATSTDSAGNTSSTDTLVQGKRRSSGGSVKFACKDSKAKNYSKFGRHKQSLCKYTKEEVKPTPDNPFGGKQCPAQLVITDNMKTGDRDGRYGSYNKSKVTQVNLLQYHMNRLLIDEYGKQASGPVDGIFGRLTKKGVERLQKRLNQLLPNMKPLVIDGVVGPFTKAAINQSCDSSIFEI